MVYISIKDDNPIILDCHKNTEDGEYFQLVIDRDTYEIIEKPEVADINVSAAYSRVFNLLVNNKPLPKKTVAEWG